MAEAILRRIKSITVRPNYRIAIAWERGTGTVVNLSDMIAKGGVFSPLADKAAFAAVRIGEHNRVLEWPEPKDADGYPIISIDADALLAKATQQQRDSLVGTIRRALNSIGSTSGGSTPAKA